MKFNFYAKDKNGEVKYGTRNAPGQREVLSWIRDCGWTAIDISQADTHRNFATHLDLLQRITTKDKIIFFRQFSTMISANIPVTKALYVIAEQTTNIAMRDLLDRIYERVMSGMSLADAMQEDKKYFSPIVIAYVHSGEASGTIGLSLAKIASFMEEWENRRKKIVSAMRYPIFVSCFALTALSLIVSVIVPQFEQAFRGLHISIPTLTLMTFAFGSWLRHYWYYILIAAVLVVLTAIRLHKSEQLKIYIDSILLKLPVFGDLTLKAALSRSLHTLATMQQCGVNLLTAIEMAADAAGNEKVRRNFLKLRRGAEAGSALNVIAREERLFPPMVIQMIATGEETGHIPEMLDKTAEWYDAECADKANRMQTLLEPSMIILIGTVVGFLTLSIYLPMISAIQALL